MGEGLVPTLKSPFASDVLVHQHAVELDVMITVFVVDRWIRVSSLYLEPMMNAPLRDWTDWQSDVPSTRREELDSPNGDAFSR